MGYKLTLISETEKMLTSKLVKQLWRNWGCNQFSIKKTSNFESCHHLWWTVNKWEKCRQKLTAGLMPSFSWFISNMAAWKATTETTSTKTSTGIFLEAWVFSRKNKRLQHTHSHFTGKRTLSFVNMASFGLTNLLNADMSSWGLFELGWGGMGMGAGTLDLPSTEWWSLGPPPGNLPPPNTLGCWFRFGH